MTMNRRVLIGSLGIALTTIAATTAGIAQNGNTVPEEYRYVNIATTAEVTDQGRQRECGPKAAPVERSISDSKAC